MAQVKYKKKPRDQKSVTPKEWKQYLDQQRDRLNAPIKLKPLTPADFSAESLGCLGASILTRITADCEIAECKLKNNGKRGKYYRPDTKNQTVHNTCLESMACAMNQDNEMVEWACNCASLNGFRVTPQQFRDSLKRDYPHTYKTVMEAYNA